MHHKIEVLYFPVVSEFGLVSISNVVFIWSLLQFLKLCLCSFLNIALFSTGKTELSYFGINILKPNHSWIICRCFNSWMERPVGFSPPHPILFNLILCLLHKETCQFRKSVPVCLLCCILFLMLPSLPHSQCPFPSRRSQHTDDSALLVVRILHAV